MLAIPSIELRSLNDKPSESDCLAQLTALFSGGHAGLLRGFLARLNYNLSGLLMFPVPSVLGKGRKKGAPLRLCASPTFVLRQTVLYLSGP